MKTSDSQIKLLPESMLKLPPGRYWVGDPCYVYPDAEWSQFCGVLNGAREDSDPTFGIVFEYGGTPFFVSQTAYGDGCYELFFDGMHKLGECGVDAGLLSVIPEQLVKLWEPKENSRENYGGVWVSIQEECKASSNGGDVKFGKHYIQTTDDDSGDEND